MSADKTKLLYPEALMIEAMKINKIPAGKEPMLSSLCSNGEYFAQLKKDGYFYEFEKTEHYNYLFSRNKSVTTGCLTEKSENVPHIINALKYLPARTILIGEIYYPGKTSKAVTEIMGCLSDKAIKRQEQGSLIHYYIHDIIYYDGYNLLNVGAEVRYKILEKIFYLHELDKYDFLELAKIETSDIEEKINKALANGEEGMVLKKKTSLYTPGKRPVWETIKIKKVDYADVVVTGFCNPTREYNGKEIETWEYWVDNCASYDSEVLVKGLYYPFYRENSTLYTPVTKPYFLKWKIAIEISAYDENGELKKIGTVSSGLTDELRKDFATNPNKYLGKVCAIQCMQLDSKEHTIRHGFFKHFREDKDPEECTFKTIF